MKEERDILKDERIFCTFMWKILHILDNTEEYGRHGPIGSKVNGLGRWRDIYLRKYWKYK